MGKEEMLRQINREINDIEMTMSSDDSVSPYSLTFSYAEERLEYLNKLKKKLKTSPPTQK